MNKLLQKLRCLLFRHYVTLVNVHDGWLVYECVHCGRISRIKEPPHEVVKLAWRAVDIKPGKYSFRN